MSKNKIGIITINDDNNYGNRLQNYAVQKFLSKYDICSENVENRMGVYGKISFSVLKFRIKNLIKLLCPLKKYNRYRCFHRFNKKYVKTSNIFINPNNIDEKINDMYDYFIVGSDQVWNTKFKRFGKVSLLAFADSDKRIAFSASFGIDSIEDKFVNIFEKELPKFKGISVRENSGKDLVKKLSNRDDAEVLVDPTMLLDAAEWEKLARKPKELNDKKYILCYFLGELSKEKKAEIEKLAKEKDCEIINLMEKGSKFHLTGPSEFLYLEKNAELICTDSFHSSVFAIIFNKPFIVFEREQKGVQSMNSRIDTLISKLELKNRKFDTKLTKENLEHDYSRAYELLEIERERAEKFLLKNVGMGK